MWTTWYLQAHWINVNIRANCLLISKADSELTLQGIRNALALGNCALTKAASAQMQSSRNPFAAMNLNWMFNWYEETAINVKSTDELYIY